MKRTGIIQVLKKKKKLSLVRSSLIILITIAIFYLIFSKVNLFSVIEVFKNSKKIYLLTGIVLSLFLPAVMAERWKIILRQIKCKISFKESFNIIISVWPINVILPSKAGDLIKAYILKDKLRASKTTGTILSERLLDLIMLAVFSLIGLLIFRKYFLALIPLAIIAGSLFFFVLSRFNIKLPIGKKWNQRINNLFLSLRILSKQKISFLKIILLTFISWYISMLQVKLFLLAFGIDLPILFIFGNIPLSIFVGLIPITIAGMGTRDSAMIILFSSYVSAPTMLSVGLLYSFTGYWVLALLGLPFAYHIFNRTKK